MATLYDNYPDGVDGTHPYFNEPDQNVCNCLMHKPMEEIDGTWNVCPWCGTPIDWDGLCMADEYRREVH